MMQRLPLAYARRIDKSQAVSSTSPHMGAALPAVVNRNARPKRQFSASSFSFRAQFVIKLDTPRQETWHAQTTIPFTLVTDIP